MVTHCTGEDGREEGGRAGPGPQALVGEQGAKPPPGGPNEKNIKKLIYLYILFIQKYMCTYIINDYKFTFFILTKTENLYIYMLF